MRLRFLPTLFALAIAMAAPLASESADVVEYYHLDAVGNVRAVTNQAGQVLERHDFFPSGEECQIGLCAGYPGVGAGQARKFTGKERDTETGLDYFGARYYGSKIGRFTTVDPYLDEASALVEPQKWNRYAYVTNNPLRYTDPDGRERAGLLLDNDVEAFVSGQISRSEYTSNLAARGAGAGVGAAIAVGASYAPAVATEVAIAGSNPRVQQLATDLVEDFSGASPGSLGIGVGRTGRQARLRELADDTKVSSANRGWISQEINQIERGSRKNIRNPPGKDLAHERGREAAKGYSYKHSHLQDRDLHKRQHRYDDRGRANKERPVKQ